MILDLRGDLDLFPRQDRHDPFRGPTSFRRIVDPGQGLQRDRLVTSVGQCTAEIMPVATHGERGRPNRTTEIERKDLRVRVTPELQRHQSEQDRLASSRRSHHEGMADVTYVE